MACAYACQRTERAKGAAIRDLWRIKTAANSVEWRRSKQRPSSPKSLSNAAFVSPGDSKRAKQFAEYKMCPSACEDNSFEDNQCPINQMCWLQSTLETSTLSNTCCKLTHRSHRPEMSAAYPR